MGRFAKAPPFHWIPCPCLARTVCTADEGSDQRRSHRAEASGRGRAFAGRDARRVHRQRNQLGRQRLRDGDLPGARDRRRADPAHAREEIEHRAGVVARRQVARIHLRSDRQAAALSDLLRAAAKRARSPTSKTASAAFAWSPDGKSIAFTMTDAKTEAHEGTRQEVRRVRGRGS